MNLPFEAHVLVVEGQPPLVGQMVKLTPLGCLIQILQVVQLKVGDRVKIRFRLPGSFNAFSQDSRVVKVYLSWGTNAENQKVKSEIMELHFVDLPNGKKLIIEEFLQKISE